MTSQVTELPGEEDEASIAVLRARGYDVPDIQALARDQQAFAVRVPERRLTIAPGVHFQAKAVELGRGCFTNAFTLRLDLTQVRVEAVARAEGFHLRHLVGADTALAAVSGSFSFISDDPAYQPTEPSLDFCCRAGEIVSLPTVTKPAFLVHRGQVVIGTLEATGTLKAQGRTYQWVGSKQPQEAARSEPAVLTVFGAANCRVRYSDHPRTGFVRDVDPATNVTPPDPTAVDYVVSWTPDDGHSVTSVHPGGGAGLFAGNFVLRAKRSRAEDLRAGARVQITQVGGLDVRHMSGGLSLGPSIADAAAGLTPGYDQCLGTSPFRDRRNARTLIGLHEGELWFQVLDGAPLTETFRGLTPAETAELCAAEGFDPLRMYHLDGGASSKIAFAQGGETYVAGSLHYLRWPHGPGEPFRWQGLEGRVLRSAFVVNSSQPEGAR
ncbi:phosphodiester glycosidase family protein [Streptomyces chartreusis]|uniref:phosphodiester glycosidase family protein n=1 Tax=Streptomyces chartreusis TaxID=1969 RepID=UPI001674C6AD|nr:hypothetical protein [Streptomyces chartreusis]GGX57973.1 hypothetical protein GCM10010321_88610 [Streptomyces chartreusis]